MAALDKVYLTDFDLADAADRAALADMLTDDGRDDESELLRRGRVVMLKWHEGRGFHVVPAEVGVSFVWGDLDNPPSGLFDFDSVEEENGRTHHGKLIERDGRAVVVLDDGREVGPEIRARLRNCYSCVGVWHVFMFAKAHGFEVAQDE